MTAVSNGTAALHVACLASGIGPGDEVIVSPITFAASANCVLYCGATPVFADIDPNSWNIDPCSIAPLITDKTKAIIAVDFGGVPIDYERIRAICNERDLLLIEDAAHSIGSARGKQSVGSMADITTFSFHPVKTITTGEGGAIATNSPSLAERIVLLAKHGITRDPAFMLDPDVGGWHYEQLELGFNYRISDLQAALGISQLAKLDQFAARRQEIVSYYNDRFSKIPELSFQMDETPEDTVRHLYCLRFDLGALGVTRRFIYDALRAEGIGVNVHYLPVYKLPYYQSHGFDHVHLPQAEKFYEEAITLPLHCCMSDKDAEDVVKAITKVIEYCRSSK